MRDLGIQNSKGVTQERKRTHNIESSSIQQKRGITEWSPSTEKRKRRRKKRRKKKKQQQMMKAWSATVLVICWLLLGIDLVSLCSSSSSFFFFFFFFFLNFWGTCLLLLWFFFFFFFPYKSLCSRFEIIRSPSDLYSSSCPFISSRSDHNFIPMYWPKFTGKLKQKEVVRTSKTGHSSQNRMVGPRSVRVLLFWHGTVLHPKQTVKQNGSRFFRLDHMARFGFQNL